MVIFHEGDTSRLPDLILKKNGFRSLVKNPSFRKWGKNARRFTYGLKINAFHSLFYDASGFLTWKRRVSPKGRLVAVILIPEPIRTERDLKRIIDRITEKYANSQ